MAAMLKFVGDVFTGVWLTLAGFGLLICLAGLIEHA